MLNNVCSNIPLNFVESILYIDKSLSMAIFVINTVMKEKMGINMIKKI